MGLLNRILSLAGIPPFPWFGAEATAMPAILVTYAWKDFGFAMILFYAGLQAIPASLLESGQMDGARLTIASGRFPDNRILSHDLIEGCHARAGLVSDVMPFKGAPATFLADAERRRCWKILDNIHRSLRAPDLVLMLVLDWLKLNRLGWWTLSLLAISLVPPLLISCFGLFRKSLDTPPVAAPGHGAALGHRPAGAGRIGYTLLTMPGRGPAHPQRGTQRLPPAFAGPAQGADFGQRPRKRPRSAGRN